MGKMSECKIRGKSHRTSIAYSPFAQFNCHFLLTSSRCIFIRPLDPEERLDVDLVERFQVAEVAADGGGVFELVCIGFSSGAGLVWEVDAVFAGGGAGDGRL